MENHPPGEELPIKGTSENLTIVHNVFNKNGQSGPGHRMKPENFPWPPINFLTEDKSSTNLTTDRINNGRIQ
jgi:hypothetical protein